MNNRSTTSQSPAQSGGKPAKGPAQKRNLLLPILLIITGCAVFMFAAWSAVRSPVLASILNRGSSSTQLQQVAPGQSYAQVYIAKPTYTPIAAEPVAQQVQPVQPVATVTPITQAEAIIAPQTDAPATEAAAAVLPAATEVVANAEVGAVVVEAAIIPDTPTAEYVAPPTAVAYVPPVSASTGGSGGVHWFDVDLSDQRMYAYEGDTLVNSFVVSTGTWQTPTVTGKFKVWVKLRSAPMSGPGYYLPDVPYVMYFYGDYGIHGTYWHNNFGVPMSHGCVNLSIPDAEWAYNFASVGTVVNVHD